jgi:PAS domain S-box-containing protein
VDAISSAPVSNGATSDPEELLDQLLRQIITGFFVLTDGQGALSKWSEPAELLFGLAADDALLQPFFGTLVPPTGLTPEAAAWRTFLETGESPGRNGRVRVDANRPGGGTFAMEAVFIPVKLDEGFDFSLFLEDLAFELPLDMMLLRMRQQHPVVIRALRAALVAEPHPWDGVRTAGTLVAFRPLDGTPWMDEAMKRREEEAAAAEAELQSRIEAFEAPSVTGTDVYDLEDARAVIDRLKWATERIEELEERSRISEDAAQLAADARVRAEAAERAALDAKAEISGAIADRPVDTASEADRLEMLTRIERVERAAAEASELAAQQRIAAETERARATELEQQRAALAQRLAAVEQTAGASAQLVEAAKTDLVRRLEAIERSGAGGAEAAKAAADALVGRLESLEAEVRSEFEKVKVAGDVTAELSELRRQIAETAALRQQVDELRERADSASSVLRVGAEREAAVIADAEATRNELAAALRRVETLTEETARLRTHLEAEPTQAGLSAEDRQRLEAAVHGAEEARTGIEAIKVLAEELRVQGAELREDGGRLQARLNELHDTESQSKHDLEALRREQAEIKTWLDDARKERDEARGQLREAVRTAEEARLLAERGPVEGDAPAPASTDEVAAARARLDELAGLIEVAEKHAEEARSDAAAVREGLAEVRDEARDAQKTAREVAERVDMVDRNGQNVIEEVHSTKAIVEEIAALARSAQQDAAESRADAGEARGVVLRLEQIVNAAREQIESAAAEAAGAREQAAAATEAVGSVREQVAGVGETAREAAQAAMKSVVADLAGVREQLDAVNAAVTELRELPAADVAQLDALQIDVDKLRKALESAEGGDAAAVQALNDRLVAIENAAGTEGLDARMDSLREGLAGALGKIETISVDMAAARNESGAGRHFVEQRMADNAAELMAARTDAEQARRGLEGLHEELASLREYAAAAKAEATAAKEAASNARKAGAVDEREIEELRTEVKAALAAMHEYKHGFEEARQAAVAARRDADMARSAAERAGVVNEATQEKFTEVWQKMLATPQRPGSGVLGRPPVTPGPGGVSKPKDAPAERAPRAGFDDDPRPMAVLDLKGKFKQLNPAFSKLVGYREHEFGKATWPSVLDRKTYKDQEVQFRAMVAGELETAAVQSTYMHGQGLMVPVDGKIVLQRDEAGAPNHLLLIAG